jgi:hypothetical protein
MTLLTRKARILCTVFAGTALFVAACGDDSTDPPSQVVTPGPDAGEPDASSNAGNGGTGGTGGTAGNGGNSGNGGNGGDTNNGPDASDGSVPGQVQFMVPANGGDVDLPVGDETITFAFPASAAGLEITLTLAEAGDIGWDADDFSVVIQMEPDGTVFDDPVIVTPSSGDLMLLNFPASSDKSAPDQLPLADDGSGLELSHFSYLGILKPAQWCESSGWIDYPNSARCANEGALSTFRQFTCKNYRFCSVTEAYCCVPPSDAGAIEGCSLGSAYLGYSFTTVGNVSGNYPYCGAVAEEDGGIVEADASTGDDASIIDLDSGPVSDAAAADASTDGGLMTCSEAIADLAGAGPTYSALACPNAGGFPAACVAALDWQLGVSCNSFCASIGLSCIYNGQAFGTSTGASCSDSFMQPTPTVTEWCDDVTDADHWCHCN